MASSARRVTTAALFGALCFTVLGIALMSRDAAMAAETDELKTAGGLTVYLGVVPAEIVKGPPTHVLLSKGPHEYDIMSKSPHDYQIVAAIFDAASGERVSHVIVTAEVFGLGLSGSKKQLEPMQIAGTTTYGGFFDLPGSDLYTVKLTVERSGTDPAVLRIQVRSPLIDSAHVFEPVVFLSSRAPTRSALFSSSVISLSVPSNNAIRGGGIGDIHRVDAYQCM